MKCQNDFGTFMNLLCQMRLFRVTKLLQIKPMQKSDVRATLLNSLDIFKHTKVFNKTKIAELSMWNILRKVLKFNTVFIHTRKMCFFLRNLLRNLNMCAIWVSFLCEFSV